MGVPLVVGGYAAFESLLVWLGIGTIAVGTGIVIAENMNEANKAAGSSQSGTTSYADACSSCMPPDDEEGEDAKERQNDPIKDPKKLEKQMEQRGWTHEKIEEAISNGEKYPAKNFQTGGSATRYVHPQTRQSIIIDDTTKGIIHIGGKGFMYQDDAYTTNIR